MKYFTFILIFIIGLNFTSVAQTKNSVSDIAVSAKLLKFYPNPASAAITFEFNKEYQGSYALQVFNFMGKKVFDIKKLPSRVIINLDEFFRVKVNQLALKRSSLKEEFLNTILKEINHQQEQFGVIWHDFKNYAAFVTVFSSI